MRKKKSRPAGDRPLARPIESSSSAAQKPVWTLPPAALAIITLAAVVMALSARGDLWFDEILSFQWAKNAKSPADIFALFRHDNNHPVNTLWIYLLGPGWPALIYRFLSICAGVGSLVLIYLITGMLTPKARWPILVWSAGSYAFILYFSEARGYGVAIACTLAAFWILLHTKRVPSSLWIAIFWGVTVLGLLSHATLIYPLAALGVWVLACSVSEHQPWRRILFACITWFLLPVLVAAIYYVFFLKPMIIAGGPRYSLLQIFSDFFAYGLGWPLSPQWTGAVVTLSFALLVAAWVWGRFRVPHMRLFLAMVIVVFPMLGLFASGAEFLYFRYFLVCLPFVFFLIAGLIERLVESKPKWLIAAWGLVIICLLFQTPRISALIVHGRGGYNEAMRYIANSPAAEKSVFSDHDMLVGMVIAFYRGSAPSYDGIRYYPNWEKRPATSDWLITTSQDLPIPKKAESLTLGTSTYHLKRVFASAPVSGAHWYLYQKKK